MANRFIEMLDRIFSISNPYINYNLNTLFYEVENEIFNASKMYGFLNSPLDRILNAQAERSNKKRTPQKGGNPPSSSGYRKAAGSFAVNNNIVDSIGSNRSNNGAAINFLNGDLFYESFLNGKQAPPVEKIAGANAGGSFENTDSNLFFDWNEGFNSVEDIPDILMNSFENSRNIPARGLSEGLNPVFEFSENFNKLNDGGITVSSPDYKTQFQDGIQNNEFEMTSGEESKMVNNYYGDTNNNSLNFNNVNVSTDADIENFGNKIASILKESCKNRTIVKA